MKVEARGLQLINHSQQRAFSCGWLMALGKFDPKHIVKSVTPPVEWYVG
jgi:hypothetical protein